MKLPARVTLRATEAEIGDLEAEAAAAGGGGRVPEGGHFYGRGIRCA